MPVSYRDPAEKAILKEPILKRIRSFYRSPRKSSIENIYNQQILMDIKRLYLSFELLDIQILNKIKIFLGQEKDDTHIVGSHQTVNKPGNNDDVYKYSRYYDISQDSLSFYDYNNEDSVTELDTIDSIGGQLSNLIYKINKLEKTI